MAVKRELLVVMKGAPDELLKSLDRAKSSFNTLGKELQSIGKSLTTAITLPLAGAGAAIIKAAGDFQASMSTVQAKTGATAKEFEALRDLAKDLGATTKFSASQAADGMTFLAQAGFKANEIMGAMPGILDLAAAGGLDLARAADIASNILSGFGLSANEAGRAADVLALAANSSNTSVEQLGTAMSYVAPVAATLGISMEETAAMIGKLSDAGIQGERAGTGLRATMLALLKPSKEAQDVFEKLGINLRDANGQLRPMTDILGEMAAKSKDAADFTAVFGREASTSAIVIAKTTPEIRTFAGELDSAGGTAKRVADVMQDNLKGAFTELLSALEGLAIAIGDSGLLAFLTDLARSATDLVRSISQTNPELLKWATILAAVVAAVGPLLYAIGGIASGISSLSALLAGTSTAWKGLMGAISSAPAVWAGITTAVSGTWAALANLPATLAAAKAAMLAMLPSAAALRAGLLVAAEGVAVIAAAFAAWKLGQWAADNIPLVGKIGDAMANLILKIPGVENALTGLGDAQDELEIQTRELEKALAAKGVTVERAGKSTLEYSKALRQAAIDAGLIKTPTEEVVRWTGELGRVTVDTGGKVKSAWKDMVAALFGKPGPWDALIQLRDSAEAAVGAAPAVDALTTAMAQSFTQLSGVLTKALKDTEGSLGGFKDWLDGIVGAVPPAQDAITDLIQSFDPLDTTLSASAVEMFDWEDKLKQAGITSQKVAEEQIALLAEKLALAQEGYANGTVSLTELNNVTDEYNAALGVTTKRSDELAQLGKQISTIMTDLSRSIADAILGAGSLGEAFVNAAKAIAEAILRTVVEGAMNVLLDSIKNNTNAMQGLIDKFKDFFGLFGGGEIKAPEPPGGSPNAPGPGGGSPTGGIGNVIDVVTGLVNAIASIFQIFQLARIEKDVGRIEVTTREIKAETMNRRTDAWDQHNQVISKWDLAVQALWDIKGVLENGLKLQTGATGGSISLVVDLPDELRLTLVALRGIAQNIMFDTAAIRETVNLTLGPEMLTQTDLLRQVVSQLEGISLALTGSEKPPVVVENLNVNAVSSDPRKLAGQILTEMEKAGSLRTGSLPAFAAG